MEYSVCSPCIHTCSGVAGILQSIDYLSRAALLSGRHQRSLLGAFAELWKATISFAMSVCLPFRMEQLGSHWTDFHEIWYLNIFRTFVEKIQVSLKSDKSNGYFTRRLITFMITSRWIIIIMRMFQTKVVEKIQTYILCSITVSENRAVYEIMWKNMVKLDTPRMSI